MDYYKPLDNLNKVDVVHIKQIGEPEQGKFGKQHQCSVTVDGALMTWTMSESKMGQFLGGGFKEGDIVNIEKWKDGPTKKGYNFKSPNKENAYEQPEQTATPMPIGGTHEPFKEEPNREYTKPTPPKDDIQERIVKGMCFNNACTLIAAEVDKCSKGDVIIQSKSLYDEMKEWLIT